MSGAKHLVLGLDGADLGVVRQLGPARLPHLHALMERGAYAALRSVQPPATLPNWCSFLTGSDPGQHGVFDFTTRQGYQVRFTGGSVREAPTLAARLDGLGKRCACLFFPATYPPEPLQHGVSISGWDSPVAFEADSSFVHPPELHAELVQRFGPQRFDDVDEFDADAEGWHERLPDALVRRVQRRAELGRHLLGTRDWDLFALYFGETDTAAHHLWALHDPHSPRRPARPEWAPAAAQDGLTRVYQAVDGALGELLQAAGGQAVEVTIVSDHGFGGTSDKVLYLNRYLQAAGLLRFKPQRLLSTLVGSAKEAALTRLPPRAREQVFRLAGSALPGLLESRARFGAIDMRGTQVFSDELNYFPALHYNLRGREPRGQVAPWERDRLRARVEAALSELRDPWSGQPVVRAVHAREELFRGPYLERAPDLLLELELDRGYSYNLMPSAGAPAGRGDADCFRKLQPHEYLGRKGRSLQGSHRDRGLYVAAGPRVRAVGQVDAHILDAARTLLARMEVDALDSVAGEVLDLLVPEPDQKPATALPRARRRRAADAGDQARVESRLRSLGYIE